MQSVERSRGQSLVWVVVAYIVATLVALWALQWPIDLGWAPALLERAAVADLAATVAIFAFSLGLRNSSMYDAYWSVGPQIGRAHV